MVCIKDIGMEIEFDRMITREEADMWLKLQKGSEDIYQEFIKLQNLEKYIDALEDVKGVFNTQSVKLSAVNDGQGYLKFIDGTIKYGHDIDGDIELTQQDLRKVYNRIKNNVGNIADKISASFSKSFHKTIKDIHDGNILIDGLIKEVKKSKIGNYKPNITRDQAKWVRQAWLYLSLNERFYESPEYEFDTNMIVKAVDKGIETFNTLGNKNAFGLAGKGIDKDILKMINDTDIDISTKDHKLINGNKESTVITYLGTNSKGYVFHIENKRLKITKVAFKITSKYKEKIIGNNLSKLKRKIQETIDEFEELNARSKKYEKSIVVRMTDNHTDSQILIDDMDDKMYPLITMIKQVRLETILGDHRRLQEDLTFIPFLLLHQLNNVDELNKATRNIMINDIKNVYNRLVKMPQIVKG